MYQNCPKIIAQYIKFKYNSNPSDIEKAKILCKGMGFNGFLEIFTGYDIIEDYKLPFDTKNIKLKLALHKLKYKIEAFDAKNYTTIKNEVQIGKMKCLSINHNSINSIYINHKNEINICDAYDEELFIESNDLNNESSIREIQNLANKKIKRQCIECDLNNKNSKNYIKQVEDKYEEI
jgi:hypothetical protein